MPKNVDFGELLKIEISKISDVLRAAPAAFSAKTTGGCQAPAVLLFLAARKILLHLLPGLGCVESLSLLCA